MAIARALVVDIAMNTAKIASDISRVQKKFGGLESKLYKVTSAVAKTAGAVVALGGAFNLAESAANFDQAEQAFANLAATYGSKSSMIIDNLDRVAAGTVSTANIMQSAGKAMLLGIPADKLEQLMSVARASARITGQSVQQAFDDIATGLGRQSKLILDNLGIVVDSRKAYEVYASSLGRTAASLTDAEKKQAFMNAALKSGDEIVKRVNVTSLTAAEAMKKFNAQIDNAKIFLGKTVIAISSFVSAVALGISTVVHTVIAGVAEMLASMTELIAKTPLIGDKFEGAAKGVRFFADAEKRAADEAAKMAAGQIEIAKGIFKRKEAMESLPTVAPAEEETGPDEKERAKMEARLERIRDSIKTEQDLQAGKLAAEIEFLNAAEQQKLDLDISYNTLREELELQHQAKMGNIEARGILDRRKFEEMNTKQKTHFVLGQLQSMTQGVATNNKTMFNLNKAAAIANATINTYQGVTQALASYPPPISFAMAAVQLAAGLSQVSAIKSASFGGASSAPSVGGGSAVPTTQASSPAIAQPGIGADENRSSQNVTVHIQNGTGDKEYWQSLVDDVIVPGINDASKRNINLTVREF